MGVFNEKTVELAPKPVPESTEELSKGVKREIPEGKKEIATIKKDKDEINESYVPKKEEDWNTEHTQIYEEPDNPLVKQEMSPGFASELETAKAQMSGDLVVKKQDGSENVLRKALETMEKENEDWDSSKRRKSTEDDEDERKHSRKGSKKNIEHS